MEDKKKFEEMKKLIADEKEKVAFEFIKKKNENKRP